MDDLLTSQLARQWREDNDLSQAALAEALGVTVVTYGGFERGGPHMKYPSMKALEAFMDGRTALPVNKTTRRKTRSVNSVRELSAPYIEVKQSAASLLAIDLRNLANILDSPDYSRDFKAVEFKRWVTFAYDELASVLQAMKQLPEKTPEP